MSELFDAIKNAPAPIAAANLAYFTIQRKEGLYIYFADKNDPANGSIDPVFLLAAYILEDKPFIASCQQSGYSIVTGYDVSSEWKKAYAGISSLAYSQAGLDKIYLNDLVRNNKLPDSADKIWTKISLSNLNNQPLTAPANGVVDNLFVPEPSKFADKEENWYLMGNPAWGTHTIPRLYMMAAILLESQRKASVVALIVDQKGVICAQGIKGPNDGGCTHAEVRAILSLKGNLPNQAGAIFSTLKPCTMCAGLLHAVDATGKFRKYWVRDDANAAADWSGIEKGFSLTNGHQLDKNCANVKHLKVGNPGENKSFFEEFGTVRKATQKTADSKKAPPEQEKAWYRDWATGYALPSKGSWTNLRFRSDKGLGEKNEIKPALIEKTVNGGMSLETFINQHLAFKDTSAKNQRGWNGIDKESAKEITKSFNDYRTKKFDQAYPGQIIKMIPWNPDSVALSNSVRNAFKAKQKKYVDFEFRNPKVKAVLNYLTDYLGQMNVPL